jgi:hypothetical protein
MLQEAFEHECILNKGGSRPKSRSDYESSLAGTSGIYSCS